MTQKSIMDIFKTALSGISQVISVSLVPIITDGTNLVMQNVEKSLLGISETIIKKVTTLLILGLACLFFITSFLYYLIESAGVSKSLAFFGVGFTLLVLGMLRTVTKR
jgi:hypothetical protein